MRILTACRVNVFGETCYYVHIIKAASRADREEEEGSRMPRTPMQNLASKVNPVVVSAGFHKATPGWLSPWRRQVQTDFDIWFIAAGGGAVRIDGQWREFRKGQLLVIKPGQNYERERTADGEPFQVYFAHVLPFGPGRRRDDRRLAEAWPFLLNVERRPELGAHFSGLVEAWRRVTGASALMARGFVTLILASVLDEISRPPVQAPPAGARVLRARALIERDYGTDLTLDAVARACGLSAGHLCAAFKRHFGCAPIQRVIELRLDRAQRLLASGCSVKEAAAAAGFHSQHYFSRLFTKKLGLTPSGFARRHARW